VIAQMAAESASGRRRRRLPADWWRGAEHDLQALAARFLDVSLAGVAIWSGLDAGAGKMSAAAAGRRKARGVKPGWPDIVVAWGAAGSGPRVLLAIELKTATGTLSAEQEAFSRSWEAQGGVFRVARCLREVGDAVEAAGIPLRFRVAPCGTRWVLAGQGRPG
jgi:hypothetical protein